MITVLQMNKQLLGAHTSIAGGVYMAIERAEILGFNAIQIFTKNNNQWKAKDLADVDIEIFKMNWKNSGVEFIVTHDSYLINLCAKDPEILEKSRSAFITELERCELLGIPFLNFHPGAHGGRGEEDGIKLIAESINIAHERTKGFNVGSMLETTAGQGTNIGYTFEQLGKIIDLVDGKNRMTVCIDTAHVFAAGYDISVSENYDRMIKEFDEIIGLEKLKCLHINDSKKKLGSRVDRHEHIGDGYIGMDGFSNIMNDRRLASVPKILETPKGKDQKEDLLNLAKLKNLIKN
ncbi:MAG: deoxyribonuclease IV [Melioribacteraceae bacterium]|nr:deoxyribonuclease IV [Melioribacteraceae bacterium]MCF8353273.1 deoxyribonuclease IV [Melioribacteraceae bacterium]MCF8394841.1 deoxyribonuclease IV [Melioribacteraceae bacterium]MCF8418800.1 deoxyribonuclease IV [Melioribacteraceae bacterium]